MNKRPVVHEEFVHEDGLGAGGPAGEERVMEEGSVTAIKQFCRINDLNRYMGTYLYGWQRQLQ